MKIGLIAMSGVRAHNEELTKLGLTLPGFVERNKVIASLPSLGLLTLAALTPKRFDVEYLEVSDIRTAGDLPTDFDLAAISSYSAQIGEAYELADRFRAVGLPVVMGGLHVTALPQEAKQHSNSVVIGEGEPLWPKVLEDFERGSLQPFYVAEPPGAYELADSPVPRYDLLNPDNYNRLTVQTSRGCPHSCEFCASSLLLTSGYKLKPVSKVIEEIHAIKAVWPRPFIEFADDNSFANHAHSKNLLRALVKERIRWFTEADIGVARDPELLGLMRDSGCKQVLIGLESSHRPSLDGLELKSNWKWKQWESYQKAVKKIQSYGIRVCGCFILGLDDDTPEVFREVLEFSRSAGLFDVQITVQTPFPGTPLYERLQRENRLIRQDAWELCTLFDPNYRPKRMSSADFQRSFVWLAKELYSAEETTARRDGFKRLVKQSPNAGRRVRGMTHKKKEVGDVTQGD